MITETTAYITAYEEINQLNFFTSHRDPKSPAPPPPPGVKMGPVNRGVFGGGGWGGGRAMAKTKR